MAKSEFHGRRRVTERAAEVVVEKPGTCHLDERAGVELPEIAGELDIRLRDGRESPPRRRGKREHPGSEGPGGGKDWISRELLFRQTLQPGDEGVGLATAHQR